MAETLNAKLIDMSFITTRMKGYQSLCTTDEANIPFAAAQLAVNQEAIRFVGR